MKKLIIIAAVVAVGVLAATGYSNSTGTKPVAAVGCTNSLVAFSGDCTNNVLAFSGNCTNQLSLDLACGTCTNSVSCTNTLSCVKS